MRLFSRASLNKSVHQSNRFTSSPMRDNERPTLFGGVNRNEMKPRLVRENDLVIGSPQTAGSPPSSCSITGLKSSASVRHRKVSVRPAAVLVKLRLADWALGWAGAGRKDRSEQCGRRESLRRPIRAAGRWGCQERSEARFAIWKPQSEAPR